MGHVILILYLYFWCIFYVESFVFEQTIVIYDKILSAFMWTNYLLVEMISLFQAFSKLQNELLSIFAASSGHVTLK